MPKNREDRRRRRKDHQHPSTSSTKDLLPHEAVGGRWNNNSSGGMSSQSRRSEAFELWERDQYSGSDGSPIVVRNSIADAKMKLHENRLKILKDMGIADKADNKSVMSKSSNAEVVRETIIEHKIQIPRKSKVKREVMREVSYDDVEMVSEEVVEMERHAEHVVTVNRPSLMLEPRVVEEIVEVPEVVIKKNFIEKKVPLIIERVKEVADDEVRYVEKQVPIHDIEYRDEVVQLEEEYIEYVDVEVPEYVEVPNYVEIAEEKHVVRDDITEVNHFDPKAVELEHVINYECPMLKPVYRDEYYDINVPRIIQVPVYEDLLPPGNLETLYILKDRFDEMKMMREPMSMRFAEDYAVHALNTFYADDRVVRLESFDKLPSENISAPSVEPEMTIPIGAPLHNRTTPDPTGVPQHQQQQIHASSQISAVGQHIENPNTQLYSRSNYQRSAVTSGGNKSYGGSKYTEGSVSYRTSTKPPATKQAKGCCAAPVSGVTPRPPHSKKDKKTSKSSKRDANTASMTGPQHSPSFSNIHFPNDVNYATRPNYATKSSFTTATSAISPPSQITAPVNPLDRYDGLTYHESKPTFGDSMINQEMTLTTASGDLTPKITETFIGQRVEKRSVDTNYVQQFVTNADPHNRHPPSAIASVPKATTVAQVETESMTAQYEPSIIESNAHYGNGRSSNEQPNIFNINAISDGSHSVYSGAKEGTLSVTESLYNEGAANRSAGLPRVDRKGGVLIHPPVPRKA